MENAYYREVTARQQPLPGELALHKTRGNAVYTSTAFTDRLIDEGIDPSVESVGDAYDNSMAESQIGLYKFELIHLGDPGGTWIRSRRRQRTGCAGPTPNVSTARSMTSYPSRLNSSTTLSPNPSTEWANPGNSVSRHARGIY